MKTLKNLTNIALTGIIGAGLSGIFGGCEENKEEVQKQMPVLLRDTCEEYLKNEFSSCWGNAIAHNTHGKGNLLYFDFLQDKRVKMHVEYVEDIPYVTCSGKEDFFNRLIIGNNGSYLMFIDSENKNNIGKIRNGEYSLENKVEYLIEVKFLKDQDTAEVFKIKKIPKEIAKNNELYDKLNGHIPNHDKYSGFYNYIRALITIEKNKGVFLK